jgi:hypothetical protein
MFSAAFVVLSLSIVRDVSPRPRSQDIRSTARRLAAPDQVPRHLRHLIYPTPKQHLTLDEIEAILEYNGK